MIIMSSPSATPGHSVSVFPLLALPAFDTVTPLSIESSGRLAPRLRPLPARDRPREEKNLFQKDRPDRSLEYPRSFGAYCLARGLSVTMLWHMIPTMISMDLVQSSVRRSLMRLLGRNRVQMRYSRPVANLRLFERKIYLSGQPLDDDKTYDTGDDDAAG